MPYLGKGGTSLGINFGTAAVIFNKRYCRDYNSQFDYICYYETDENGVPFAFPTVNERYKAAKATNFSKIPGSPVAYWVSDQFINVFQSSVPLGTVAYSFQGLITGDNNHFLRFWFEPSEGKLCLHIRNSERHCYNGVWVPYQKGGNYRRWYGNNEYVLRWEDQGKTLTRARTENSNFYFKQCVTWSFLTSSTFSCRLAREGTLWDVAGSSIFETGSVSAEYICALMNSNVAQLVFDVTNPTLNYQVMNITSLPYKKTACTAEIENIAGQCIKISEKDWDSYETSWDFKRNPLV